MLEMKYFVLKPRGKGPFPEASRAAMRSFARSITTEDETLAETLLFWAETEERRANGA
jgi:hypothetical protein